MPLGKVSFTVSKGKALMASRFRHEHREGGATFDDIESFYHRTRRHSTLNDMSPLSYEQVMCSIPSLGSPQIRVKITSTYSGRREGVKVMPTSKPSGPKRRVTVCPHGSCFDAT